MNIPVRYNDLDVGEVTEFNKDTGEMTVSLDMSKEGSQLVKALVINDTPISMSYINEPSKPSKPNEWELDINPQHNGQLYDLAEEYHQRTEQYDRTICTGPIRHGGIIPWTAEQRAAINRHAKKVLKEMVLRARCLGFSAKEMQGMISHVSIEFRYKESYDRR
jgi:hypothetical protein